MSNSMLAHTGAVACLGCAKRSQAQLDAIAHTPSTKFAFGFGGHDPFWTCLRDRRIAPANEGFVYAKQVGEVRRQSHRYSGGVEEKEQSGEARCIRVQRFEIEGGEYGDGRERR
eukprot:3244647-Pleurochrysis_carterae.AAC.1